MADFVAIAEAEISASPAQVWTALTDPERRLKVTHFSPMSGQEDVPENYHTLTYELEDCGATTHISLSQDNNASEEQAEQFKGNWQSMLDSLKEVVERG